jgi:hypothetical protein
MINAIEFNDAPGSVSVLNKFKFGLDELLQVGRAFGAIHGYAIDLAQKIKVASPLALSAAMREALTGLTKHKLITGTEEQLLSGFADAMAIPNDLLGAQQALDKITSHLGDAASPVAAMLVSIASDSIARDRQANSNTTAQLPPGAHAFLRELAAWGADVGAGAVGGLAGGVVANVPGALIVGGIAAAAASGAVLK